MVNSNFYYLSTNLKKCAQYHADIHIHRCVTIYTQILSTIWHASLHRPNCNRNPRCYCYPVRSPPKGIYRPMQETGPVVLWGTENMRHYNAILEVAKHLADERRRRNVLFEQKGVEKRYKEVHRSEAVLKILEEDRPMLQDDDWQDPPLLIPRAYRELGLDTVSAYRMFYAGHKKQLWNCSWYPAEEPSWVKECERRMTPGILEEIDRRLTEIKANRKVREDFLANMSPEEKERREFAMNGLSEEDKKKKAAFLERISRENKKSEEVPLKEVSKEDVPLKEVTKEEVPLKEVSKEETPLKEVSEEEVPLKEVSEEEEKKSSK